MSVLINGIEMPTDSPMWIVVHSDGTVEANDVSASLGWQILRNAAVPVPPHGRLIDADELEYHADNVRDPMGRTEKTVMWKKIETAPTIIEAEVKE